MWALRQKSYTGACNLKKYLPELLRSLQCLAPGLWVKKKAWRSWTRALVSRFIRKPYPANIIPGTTFALQSAEVFHSNSLLTSSPASLWVRRKLECSPATIATHRPGFPSPSIFPCVSRQPVVVPVFWQRGCQGVWAWTDAPGLLRTLCSHHPDIFRLQSRGA